MTRNSALRNIPITHANLPRFACSLSSSVPHYIVNQLDILFRCGICYDYITTALVTACSHNYCSLCIRKSLIYKTECPICHGETYESQLRNNRILDDIICIYSGIREKLVSLILNFKQDSDLVNRKKDPCGSQSSLSNENYDSPKKIFFRTPKKNPENKISTEFFNKELIADNNLQNIVESQLQIKKKTNEEFLANAPSCSSFSEGNTVSKSELTIPSMFSPKKSATKIPQTQKVSCPVCDVLIPETNINIHLDTCLRRAEQKTEKREVDGRRKPLPKLVYHLLKPIDLKKKLKEIGLNTNGDKKALINRHQRFTLLYNAECDSLNPRPIDNIIKQVESEEQEEKKVSSATIKPNFFAVNKNTDEATIEKVNTDYLKENKSSFNALIENIKKQREKKKEDPKQAVVESIPKNQNSKEYSPGVENSLGYSSTSKTRVKRLQYIDSDSDSSDIDFIENPKVISVNRDCEEKVRENSKTPDSLSFRSCSDSDILHDPIVCSNIAEKSVSAPLLSPVICKNVSYIKKENLQVPKTKCSPEMFLDSSGDEVRNKKISECNSDSDASISLLTGFEDENLGCNLNFVDSPYSSECENTHIAKHESVSPSDQSSDITPIVMRKRKKTKQPSPPTSDSEDFVPQRVLRKRTKT